jgi:sterol desaturase/sphingolipid hydroxylase (fatty acid hydroxylase superfamily)
MKIDDILGMCIPVLFFLALAIETRYPARTFENVKAWRWIGLGFFILIMSLNALLPIFLPLDWIREHSLLPGAHLGVFAGVIVGYLVASLAQYAVHRAQHANHFLWRWSHQLHHSALRVDVAGFVYTHPFEMLLTLLSSLFVSLFILGLDPVAAAIVGFIPAVAGIVQHLNCRTPEWIELFMQRPEAHVLHHERNVHYGNFGDLPLWDKLFGTYRQPVESKVAVGFDPALSARVGSMLLGRDVELEMAKHPAP